MELMEMVKAHSLLASKFLPRTVDVDHPQTNLFLNSNGIILIMDILLSRIVPATNRYTVAKSFPPSDLGTISP